MAGLTVHHPNWRGVAAPGAVKITRIICLTIVTHFVSLLFAPSMYSLYTWQSFCVKFIPIVKWDSIGAIRRRSKKEEAHNAPLGELVDYDPAVCIDEIHNFFVRYLIPGHAAIVGLVPVLSPVKRISFIYHSRYASINLSRMI